MLPLMRTVEQLQLLLPVDAVWSPAGIGELPLPSFRAPLLSRVFEHAQGHRLTGSAPSAEATLVEREPPASSGAAGPGATTSHTHEPERASGTAGSPSPTAESEEEARKRKLKEERERKAKKAKPS